MELREPYSDICVCGAYSLCYTGETNNLIKQPCAKLGFPGGASGKEPACQCRRHKRHGLDPWVGKIPWRRKWQPIPVFLPEESHGQRNLAGYSPQSLKELTEAYVLLIHFAAQLKVKQHCKAAIPQ